MNEPSHEQPIVFVIDDDKYVRDGLTNLFRSVGLRVETFSVTSEFVQRKPADVASCLVLDVRLPGDSGLDFQAELAKENFNIPIIFITGHGDIPMTVRAMKGGAVEFLTKPFREQELLDAIRVALDRDRARREHENAVADLRVRFNSLSSREQEITALVTSGLMNKQSAARIGISEVTVKVHRHNVMRKMGAKSLADLVRMVDILQIRRAKP